MLPIHRIAVPNPFFEGYNSVYLLHGDPITLIDTGVATSRAFEYLEAGLGEHGLCCADIERVLLTHKHIDHIGNAWRIARAGGAELMIHECECKSLSEVDPSGERFAQLVRERIEPWGIPEELLPEASGAEMPRWDLEPCQGTAVPKSLPIEFGGQRYELEVIETPGHTMGSVCFRLADCLFSGDHVLERVSPNVGGGDLRSRGMLGRFLASLRTVQALQNVRVYPGHGEPFDGLEDRCQRLLRHHQIRLRQARRAVERGRSSVWEVARTMYGKLHDFHIVLGCAEANAHLEFLVDSGEIQFSEPDNRFLVA